MKPERIRRAFGKLTAGIGLSTVTAPKSWRHTFATAMLEAGVDPKVRWITLGHSSHEDGKGPLGMTGVYSHPQREVHRQQLQRVVDLRPKTSDLARSFLEEGLIRSEVLPGMGTKP
jgi:site-specific recombinase XerD